ncbi:hypothetical protein GCM10023318_11430 [Nocardia callitridis]|uniref:Uncharacterized protein n=1 Tax=Nocardia callitridis TaxID=648753 RepID=A0ABP9JWL4_9NOCA
MNTPAASDVIGGSPSAAPGTTTGMSDPDPHILLARPPLSTRRADVYYTAASELPDL